MPNQFTLHTSIVIAGIGSTILVLLAGVALFRRQSLAYVFITMAIGTLTLRSFLGGMTLAGHMSTHMHHSLEHLLDVLVIGLLFAAIYVVRTIRPDPQFDESRPQKSQ